jgi:hypothetical protein
VHLGGKLSEGVVDWAQDTREAELVVVRKKTRDAVREFLSPGYWERVVAELAEKADKPVTDASKAVEVVGKKLAFSADQQTTILDHFILGGQLTAGGLMNAVTSAAQTVKSPDTAADMESAAVKVLDLV